MGKKTQNYRKLMTVMTDTMPKQKGRKFPPINYPHQSILLGFKANLPPPILSTSSIHQTPRRHLAYIQKGARQTPKEPSHKNTFLCSLSGKQGRVFSRLSVRLRNGV